MHIFNISFYKKLIFYLITLMSSIKRLILNENINEKNLMADNYLKYGF